MTWKQRATAVIQSVMHQARAENLDHDTIVACVDAAYPFGPRKHYPYRAWLAARRELLFAPYVKRRAPTPTGQMTLFEDNHE